MTMNQALSNTNPVRQVEWVDYINPTPAPGTFHVVILSDVHLGHGRVPTRKMIEDLELFLNPDRLKLIDFIIITGDLFDQRLPHDSTEAYLISRWMERLLRACKQYNVAIRILEGTPSHDQRQSQWMVTYNEMTCLGVDLRYYPELSIDELFPGGPMVLWVPDEVNHDANRTWLEVQALMRDRALDKVDFGFMHGFFRFQAPVETVSSHDEDRYQGIVRHLIVNGHDHTHKVLGIIRIPGSPDRHKHRQEEAKGHLQFSFSPEKGVHDEQFIVNHRAVIFTTLDVVGKSYPEVEKLLSSLEDSPDGSNYRLRLSRSDETYSNFSRLKTRFPHFKLTHDTVEAKKITGAYESPVERPILTSIRSDTLSGLVVPRLSNLSPEALKFAEQELNS